MCICLEDARRQARQSPSWQCPRHVGEPVSALFLPHAPLNTLPQGLKLLTQHGLDQLVFIFTYCSPSYNLPGVEARLRTLFKVKATFQPNLDERRHPHRGKTAAGVEPQNDRERSWERRRRVNSYNTLSQ